MPAERFDFPNARGEKLAAVLDLPEGNPRAYALFAHCFTCGKNVLAAKRIADAPGMTAEKWADAVRPTYKGDLVVAHDLREIPL